MYRKRSPPRPIGRTSRRVDRYRDTSRYDNVRDHSISADSLEGQSRDRYIPADDTDRSEHADNYGGDVIDDTPVKPAKKEKKEEEKTPKEEAKSADF